MRHFNNEQLSQMTKRYKAQVINSLSGFKSANLIGTCNKQGLSNLAIFSSVVHLGSSPALIGFISRPNSVVRDTLANIQQTNTFTINHVNADIWQAAHQTSARYDEDDCEFQKTGLSKEFLPKIEAPFVKESQLKFALSLQEIIPIALNNTQLVIGQVTDIICDEIAIKDDGYIDIEYLNTVSVSGLDSYHSSQRLARLPYAKPDDKSLCISAGGK
ncbi:flavin reductase family protein [Colwelliaceae bacterium 6441]